MPREHERRDDLSAEEMKAAMKDALREWLDDKFSELGKWSLRAMLAAVLAALTFFILSMNGYHKGAQ